MIRSKLKALFFGQHFPHYKFMGKFFIAQGRVTPMNSPIYPKIELVRDFMTVFLTCEVDEDCYPPDNISLIISL